MKPSATWSATILEEAERLNRFIANLLDMTKLESGAIQPNFSLIDVDDVVGTALRPGSGTCSPATVSRLRCRQACRPMPRRSGAVRAGAVQSARQCRPNMPIADTTIRIAGKGRGRCVTIEVLDEGPGIPPPDLERVFDKFYAAGQGRQRARRHRARPGHLPRLRRGDGRHDHWPATAPTGRARCSPFACRSTARPRRSRCHDSGAGQDPGRRRRAADPPAAAGWGSAAQGYAVVEASNGKTALDRMASDKRRI